jgi:Ser-tRNA(Ala) deacylase AlaX
MQNGRSNVRIQVIEFAIRQNSFLPLNIVIFPEGGGQPCDYGTLTLQSDVGGAHNATVKEAFRKDLAAIHIGQFPTSFDPLANGWTPGAKVHMEVDWERRTYRTCLDLN